MFYIFGSPRSGTTLLSSILDLNDAITIPDETDFIIPTAFIIDRITDVNIGKKLIKEMIVSSKRFEISIGQYLNKEDIFTIIDNSAYNLQSIITNIYACIAIKTGAIISGDKSPNDLLYLRILVETGLIHENLKIIHIIRDIRDVILSLKNVDWDVDWKENIESFFPRYWCDSNLYLHNLLKSKTKNYILIKYEDLINNPRNEVIRLSLFLDIPFQEKMMLNENRGQKYKDYSHHQNLNQPLLKSRINTWKELMPDNIKQLCKQQAIEAIIEFGYDDNDE